MKKLIMWLTLFVVVIIGLSVVSYKISLQIQNKSNLEQTEKAQHVSYKSTISTEKLNYEVVDAFLYEMLSNDYEMLLPLFKDSQSMNIEEVTKAMNELKENKDVVKSYILSSNKKNGVINFTIVLKFNDNTEKPINIEISNGKILTRINQLTIPGGQGL